MKRSSVFVTAAMLLWPMMPLQAQELTKKAVGLQMGDTVRHVAEPAAVGRSLPAQPAFRLLRPDMLQMHPLPSPALRHLPVPRLTDPAGVHPGFAVSTGRSPVSHGMTLKSLTVPAMLIGFSFWGNGNDWFEHQNKNLRAELQENIDRKLTIDDYAQFAPLVASFALGWAGVMPRHDFGERAIVGVMSLAISQLFVQSLKNTIHKERPDHSARNSFPSGHTTMAFLGAEMLYQEYRDVSPWIGYAGYAVAAGTGFFRMYNNRHWLTDVIAGAGLGMMSTKLAYWLYRRLFPPHAGKHRLACTMVPFSGAGQHLGISVGICL